MLFFFAIPLEIPTLNIDNWIWNSVKF